MYGADNLLPEGCPREKLVLDLDYHYGLRCHSLWHASHFYSVSATTVQALQTEISGINIV